MLDPDYRCGAYDAWARRGMRGLKRDHTARVVIREHARQQFPSDLLIWAGDFNQSLHGPNQIGSMLGRSMLLDALTSLGLTAWNASERHAAPGLRAIDLICSSSHRSARAVTVMEVPPNVSDHFGYLVDL